MCRRSPRRSDTSRTDLTSATVADVIRHIVMWTLAEGPDKAANVEQARAGLAGLARLVPGIHDFQVVVPAPDLEHTHDLLLVVDFEDVTALHTYATHPDHLAVAEFLGAVRSSRACVDYEIDQIRGV